MSSIQSSNRSGAGLTELESRVAHDLSCLNYPPENWAPETTGPDGKAMLDVLIVGSGMCGQSAAFALQREGVRNLRIIDRNPFGHEGPWGTFARMPTLRSPKHVNGPDLGIPSLTFRAWYEAQHGASGWESLYKIDKLDWLAYLLWVRKMAGIDVENGIQALSITPEGDHVRIVTARDGQQQTVYARRVVMALGRDGSGDARWPEFPSFDPHNAHVGTRVFHSSSDIDFSAWQGKNIAILGAGASAFDNAGTALEHGASTVTLYARRPYLPQVNKSKWASFIGFLRGYAQLSDEDRWRLYSYILAEQAPPPHESVLRCERHIGFQLKLGMPWTDLRVDGNGVVISTGQTTHRVDAVILATGFAVDIATRPELANISSSIDLWGNHVDPEEARAQPEAARFPYLSEAFALQAAGTPVPGLDRIHVFNWGSTLSQGALSSDIPGLAIGATRLADGLVRLLFAEDVDYYDRAIREFEDPELAPTSYFVPRELRKP